MRDFLKGLKEDACDNPGLTVVASGMMCMILALLGIAAVAIVQAIVCGCPT